MGRARAYSSSWIYPLLFLVAGLVACLFHRPLELRLASDNVYYFAIAERAASGVPPHVSHFDPKTSLSSLISGAAIFVGRGLGAADLTAARAVSMAFAAASVALVWLLARRLTRSLLAAHLAALVMLGLPLFIQMGTMGARPKIFLVPFLLSTLLAFGARRPVWAGFFGALTLLCWQVGVLVPAIVAGYLLLDGNRRGFLRFFLGAALAILPYEAYFLAHGALGEQLLQSVWYPLAYMSRESSSLVENAARILRILPGLGWESILPGIFVIALAIAWVRLLIRPRTTWRFLREDPIRLVVFLSATCALGFTLYETQGYPDRFFVDPFVAITTGILGALVTRRLGGSTPAGTSRAAYGAGLIVALVVLAVTNHLRCPRPLTLRNQYEQGEWVARRVAEGKTVYAVKCSHLLSFHRIDNFATYSIFPRGMAGYLEARTGSPEYRPLVGGELPDIVLVHRKIPESLGWIPREYEKIEGPGGKLVAWERRPE